MITHIWIIPAGPHPIRIHVIDGIESIHVINTIEPIDITDRIEAVNVIN